MRGKKKDINSKRYERERKISEEKMIEKKERKT